MKQFKTFSRSLFVKAQFEKKNQPCREILCRENKEVFCFLVVYDTTHRVPFTLLAELQTKKEEVFTLAIDRM